MKWLTLELIKQQLRIEPDFTDEDKLLEKYGNSAEQTVMNITRRTYDNFMSEYGQIPDDIVHATLLMVTESYEHHSPVSMQNMSIIPYALDIKLKPYMRLASDDVEREMQTVVEGSDVKIEFTADLPDGLLLKDVDFTVKVENIIADKSEDYEKADCIMLDEGATYVALVDTSDLGVGDYMLKLTVHIPDTDYPSGYRKEVVKINPYIRCIG